jgi:streptogramin lyase
VITTQRFVPLTRNLGCGLLVLGSLVANAVLGAATGSVGGIVRDAAGKPVRGAIVSVTMGTKLVARYTGNDGRYLIQGLDGGKHAIGVTAFGFAPTSQMGEAKADFRLTPRNAAVDMNTAELRYLISDNNKDQQRVYFLCAGCHGWEQPLARTGMPTEAWQGFLTYMTNYRWGASYLSQKQVVAIAPLVAQVFGPDGVLGPNAKPDFSKVKNTPLQASALTATITEYQIPSKGGQPHSIRSDRTTGRIWFADYDSQSNDIFNFDPKTERFQEFKIPLQNAAAHTGSVLKDGSYIVGLDSREHTAIKLAMVDADGKVSTINWAGKPRGTRVVARDPANENIVWIVAGPETWRLNVRTKELRAYRNPTPPTLPKGSYAEDFAQPGDQPFADGYDVAVDSKGIPWVSQLTQGVLFSIDPENGTTKMYHTPEMYSTRGVAIDPQDNIWYADFYGHKVGMLDPTTGNVKLYKPPNPNASPYGLAIDPKRGYIWYADTLPNSVSRVDPKTGEFAEYPLPTARASLRFVTVDPQGRVWYGGFFNSKLGMIDPGDGSSTGSMLTSRLPN